MKTLSIEKGLLRETGSIQDQIKALVKCDVSRRLFFKVRASANVSCSCSMSRKMRSR